MAWHGPPCGLPCSLALAFGGPGVNGHGLPGTRAACPPPPWGAVSVHDTMIDLWLIEILSVCQFLT